MGISSKLTYLDGTKAAIAAAIEAKGVTVGPATFRGYAAKVAAIPLWNDTLTWYGIEWDILNPNPLVTRIGNLGLHASLPVQSNMKGCMLNDDGTVNYYLKSDDWTLRADGITAAVHDGSEGQVMIEIPAHWILFEDTIAFQRVKISAVEQVGWISRPVCYVSAYEAAVKRDTLTLSSVINLTTNYRGGNNISSWDGTYRTLIGMPATNISKTNFRTYARNRGVKWNILPDHVHNSLVWMYMIEYANKNSQAAINNTLDANGCRQGGLGSGVTTTDSTSWTNYNSTNPFVPCGHTNSLGNNSGEISIAPSSYPGGVSFMVNRYRGIENPFGHIWKVLDGIMINGTLSESQVYSTVNPAYFTDTITNMIYIGLTLRSDNYFNLLLFGDTGCILPKSSSVAASALTFWCDYFYQSTSATLRAVYVGGVADYGSVAGFVCTYAIRAASYAYTYLGSRLCLLP